MSNWVFDEDNYRVVQMNESGSGKSSLQIMNPLWHEAVTTTHWLHAQRNR